MKIDRNELFRELTPPAGGAARMRSRLATPVGNSTEPRAGHSAPSPASWLFVPAGVAAVLLIAVLVAVALRSVPSIDSGSTDGGSVAGEGAPPAGELYAAADLDRLLGRPSTPFELSVSLGDERLDLIEIPTRDPLVRIVRIEEGLPN